jgi:hypothetical protein
MAGVARARAFDGVAARRRQPPAVAEPGSLLLEKRAINQTEAPRAASIARGGALAMTKNQPLG